MLNFPVFFFFFFFFFFFSEVLGDGRRFLRLGGTGVDAAGIFGGAVLFEEHPLLHRSLLGAHVAAGC